MGDLYLAGLAISWISILVIRSHTIDNDYFFIVYQIVTASKTTDERIYVLPLLGSVLCFGRPVPSFLICFYKKNDHGIFNKWKCCSFGTFTFLSYGYAFWEFLELHGIVGHGSFFSSMSVCPRLSMLSYTSQFFQIECYQ